LPQPVDDVGRNPARALDLGSASGKLRRQIIDGGEQPRRSTPDGVLFDGRVCASASWTLVVILVSRVKNLAGTFGG
jgi:hypothetical protein